MGLPMVFRRPPASEKFLDCDSMGFGHSRVILLPMTADEILWLSGLCGSPRSPVARAPWLKSPDLADGLTFRPDAGWKLACRFVKSGLSPLVLRGPRFYWIRQAARWIGGNGDFLRRSADLLVTAKEIHGNSGARQVLNALLMASDSSVKGIASLAGCQPLAVSAYDQLFFNVLDRKHDLLYLAALCEGDQGAPGHASADGTAAPLRLDPRATMAEVMVLAGFGNSSALDPSVLRRRLADRAFRDSEGPPTGRTGGRRRAPQLEEPGSQFPESGIGAILRAQLVEDAERIRRRLGEEQIAADDQNQMGKRIGGRNLESAG